MADDVNLALLAAELAVKLHEKGNNMEHILSEITRHFADQKKCFTPKCNGQMRIIEARYYCDVCRVTHCDMRPLTERRQ